MKNRKKQGSGSAHNIDGLFGVTKRPKKSKFNNVKTTVYGIEFHSKHEAERYVVLRALNAQGLIRGLCMQQPYKLNVNGVLIAKYISDFEYLDNGEWVVEDAKGFRTREYIMKRKLMKAIYGITIRET